MALHPLEAVAGGALLTALVVAGIALTIYGLRNDARERRRSYRRRGRRPPDGGERPVEPAKG
jgi:hypothetical protein